MVNFVDDDRVWTKSTIGLDCEETPRDIAFCARTIETPNTMFVADTHLDERFVASPFVVKDPKIRFYAGAPLIDEAGFRLGSLCVIDRKPRQMSHDLVETLELIANQVIRLVQLRKFNLEMGEALARTRGLADLVPICAHCHSIRDSRDDWQRVEEYFGQLGGAKFSHGVCPGCMVEHYSEHLNNLVPRAESASTDRQRVRG